jgi:hypothetical protein
LAGNAGNRPVDIVDQLIDLFVIQLGGGLIIETKINSTLSVVVGFFPIEPVLCLRHFWFGFVSYSFNSGRPAIKDRREKKRKWEHQELPCHHHPSKTNRKAWTAQTVEEWRRGRRALIRKAE